MILSTPQNSLNILKNLELITTSNANNFQTADKPRIPLSSLSASMENDNLEKQEESEIVISNKCISNTDDSSIDLTDPDTYRLLIQQIQLIGQKILAETKLIFLSHKDQLKP